MKREVFVELVVVIVWKLLGGLLEVKCVIFLFWNEDFGFLFMREVFLDFLMLCFFVEECGKIFGFFLFFFLLFVRV